MKKIIVILFSLVLILGYVNISFAVTGDDKEEPVKVEAETEDLQEEIVIEEVETESEAVESEMDVEEDEPIYPYMCGEWYYDLTEHEDGSITYYRWYDNGEYEELSEQTFYDAGGQYENCDKGRHYWCEDTEIRYCEECGYIEER